MRFIKCNFFLILLFYNNSVVKSSDVKILDTSNHILTRDKRYLVWKEGVNWVAMIFGIAVPFEVDHQSITLGATMKAYYQLPNNSSYFTMPSLATLDADRRKRSTSRWLAYDFLEQVLKRNNYPDGKACLLKSICELASIKLEERAGLLAEIVHALLTPSSTKDEVRDHGDYEYYSAEKLGREGGRCDDLYAECPLDPIGQYSKFMTVGNYFL